MTPEREAKIRRAVHNAQFDLGVVLENVFDPHNIFAVIRSCDAVGIREVWVIDTVGKFPYEKNIGMKSSASSRKWIQIHYFTDLEEAVAQIKRRYGRILTTAVGRDSKDLYALDLTEPTALVFGNEREGISPEMLVHADGNFRIPLLGMIKSLNISVACAVSIFEAMRQRRENGMYSSESEETLPSPDHEALFRRYEQIQQERFLQDKEI